MSQKFLESVVRITERHFEVNAQFIALAILSELAREGAIDRSVVRQALKEFEIDPEKPNPATT